MSIDNFNKISDIINQSTQAFTNTQSISNYFKEVQAQLNMFTEQQEKIRALLLPKIEAIKKQQEIFKTVLPQIAFYSEALKPYIPSVLNKTQLKIYDFDKVTSQWRQLAILLGNKRIESILLNDYWIVLEEDLIEELKAKSQSDNFDINKHIIWYYSNHKFANIKNVINQIKNYQCLNNKQLEIFDDCYKVMQKLPYKTACNTIIPTLTAQTDGLLNTICSIIPKGIKEEIIKEQNVQKNSTATIILTYLNETFEANKTTTQFKEVIKNKAFSKLKKNDKYKKSRHKILHGTCDYGNKENLVRCWLEIAFLIKVYFLILIRQNENIDSM